MRPAFPSEDESLADRDEQYFRAPLSIGEGIGHWQLGRRHEERFDVADQPMDGEMDPLFFLAKDRNFIPHEYPCRREFAARYRGKPPAPTIAFEPAGWHFPFGSPRVDLSGFWFRPTRIECWARTAVQAAAPQVARFRFVTCGGALLKVNGDDVAALTGYRRNFEEAMEVDVVLAAGRNQFDVWFGDLCERDARYYFELSLLKGEGLTVAMPVGVEPEVAQEIEALLQDMRFEQPSFQNGDVIVLLPSAASVDFAVTIDEVGDFLSKPTQRQLILHKGKRRLSLVTVDSFPPDFRHFTFTFERRGFSLSRTLAVEIGREPNKAPDKIEARAIEALSYVGERAEPDPARALARLATGRAGAETDATLAAALPPIVDCHDCADFLLVPLLWCRIAFGDAIAPKIRDDIDKAIFDFRYWMDEPGNDVMWFFSENHALLFHTACYLAGSLFPGKTFRRSGRRGREQSAVGRKRLLAWFDHFETAEMAEWNSAPYFPIDFKGLAALFALAPDADIRDRAKLAILRLLEIVALSSHQGVLTASQGRSYEHSLRPCRTYELSNIARLFFGEGGFGSRFHALPLLALCVRDHGLRVDQALTDLAFWRKFEALEWCFKQGQNGVAALYHYKTRNHAMGSITNYRPGEWGYQETVLHLRLGSRPEAQIWINHPGERVISGFARPSFWGGCGTLPRVCQYRDLAVLDFNLRPGHVPFTHAWLPEAEMDDVRFDASRVVVRAGAGMALLVGSGSFDRVMEGPTAGCEIRLHGVRSRWIIRLSDQDDRNLSVFSARFAALAAIDSPDDEIWLDDPEYGRVVFHPDGRAVAEGRIIDPATWTHTGQATVFPGGMPYPLPSQDQPKN
jgi:hypothetical protein